jgi:hypothetical protein
MRRRSWGARCSMPIRLAYRFTAYQTTSVVAPSSCRVRFFETRLNILPSVTPATWTQASVDFYSIKYIIALQTQIMCRRLQTS